MENNYRSRVCPICGGVVKCDLGASSNNSDGLCNPVFIAVCTGCKLHVAGSTHKVFDLFHDNKDTVSVTIRNEFFDTDSKWVHYTATYKGMN